MYFTWKKSTLSYRLTWWLIFRFMLSRSNYINKKYGLKWVLHTPRGLLHLRCMTDVRYFAFTDNRQLVTNASVFSMKKKEWPHVACTCTVSPSWSRLHKSWDDFRTENCTGTFFAIGNHTCMFLEDYEWNMFQKNLLLHFLNRKMYRLDFRCKNRFNFCVILTSSATVWHTQWYQINEFLIGRPVGILYILPDCVVIIKNHICTDTQIICLPITTQSHFWQPQQTVCLSSRPSLLLLC